MYTEEGLVIKKYLFTARTFGDIGLHKIFQGKEVNNCLHFRVVYHQVGLLAVALLERSVLKRQAYEDIYCSRPTLPC